MFSQEISDKSLERDVHNCLHITKEQARRCVEKSTHTYKDLSILLSPAAQPYLETLAQKSRSLTRQRFGHTMQLFIPLYLSNECFNQCTYCGFSMEHDYPRTTLTNEQILTEAKHLHEKGFRHILLLTGESPKKVDANYISNAITLIRNYFPSIGIEVQPLSKEDYKQVFDAGADSLTLYQETYHYESYLNYHLSGIKRRYHNRLDAVERAADAGFYRINIGALLGLYDWRYDCLALASHLHYLQKRYWKCKYSVSFPRIKDMIGDFNVHYPVTDKDLVQIITAFRLVFPDCGITLSTREPANLRDNICELGITQLSAESNTSPGGYNSCESEEQFSISDHRPLSDICKVLESKKLEPVFKDWDGFYIQ